MTGRRTLHLMLRTGQLAQQWTDRLADPEFHAFTDGPVCPLSRTRLDTAIAILNGAYPGTMQDTAREALTWALYHVQSPNHRDEAHEALVSVLESLDG